MSQQASPFTRAIASENVDTFLLDPEIKSAKTLETKKTAVENYLNRRYNMNIRQELDKHSTLLNLINYQESQKIYNSHC